MKYSIQVMNGHDWEVVKNIYLQGINTNKATFQPNLPSWKQWDEGHLQECRFVIRADDNIVGWSALGAVSGRECYRGVVEVSIYIAEEARGLGLGEILLNHTIKASEQAGFWSLYSAVLAENIGSIALHKKCGFRQIGVREKLAKMESTGKWHDVVLFERRSKSIGIN
ncbi:phosphinothricin acetyltransferase [Pectinatus brassicae]|uniref:Phosphinothricin acetyltransferase n=1 Tax=Pectinatus brassicae TaxID=862415 RepID=A0A840UUY4_9FIRM|nr:GNAT family N-acetyltransferase [Pectinatus brassicae]MBB5336265.1 phosphinothricin acetyltransferase [Pectinatus brassicae]